VISQAFDRPGVHDMLGTYAAGAAHHLGEAAALLSAGLSLPGPVGDRSLRAARDRLQQFVSDHHDVGAPVNEGAFRPSDIGPLAESARRAMHQLPGAERLSVVVREGGPPVLGDPPSLTRALCHLFRAATASASGPVCVTVAAVPDGGRVRVTVSDDGEPLPSAAAAGLFEPFAPARGRGPLVGAGVSAAVAERVVSAHGGAITAAPGSPRGATVVFDLQAA